MKNYSFFGTLVPDTSPDINPDTSLDTGRSTVCQLLFSCRQRFRHCSNHLTLVTIAVQSQQESHQRIISPLIHFYLSKKPLIHSSLIQNVATCPCLNILEAKFWNRSLIQDHLSTSHLYMKSTYSNWRHLSTKRTTFHG